MSQQRKIPKQKPESYQPGEKPVIISLVEEKQKLITEVNKVFVRNYNVEMVTLDEEIKVVGMSYNKCKQTGLLELNSPFDLYARESFELQDHINSLCLPQIGYGIWGEGAKDVLVGKGVTDLDGQDDVYGSFVIPAGRYLKVSFNAETFDELVNDALQKSWEHSGANVLLVTENLAADHALYIEVYPHETCCVGQENGPGWGPKYIKASMTAPATPYPEMYTLHTVKEKEPNHA